MKHTILTITILFVLVSTEAVFAEEQAEPGIPAESVAAGSETPVPANPEATCQMPGMDKMHKGQGRHRKSHCCMKHGGGHHGKGQHDKHEQVVQRLDMIEARIAKIEAMLEILMRR